MLGDYKMFVKNNGCWKLIAFSIVFNKSFKLNIYAWVYREYRVRKEKKSRWGKKQTAILKNV